MLPSDFIAFVFQGKNKSTLRRVSTRFLSDSILCKCSVVKAVGIVLFAYVPYYFLPPFYFTSFVQGKILPLKREIYEIALSAVFTYLMLCWCHKTVKFLSILLTYIYTHFYRIIEEGGSGRPPPPPPHRSFENRWRNIDILYITLKGIVWRFRFSLKFSKILWSRDFMSKFSRNDSSVAPEWMSEKIQTLKILTY